MIVSLVASLALNVAAPKPVYSWVWAIRLVGNEYLAGPTVYATKFDCTSWLKSNGMPKYVMCVRITKP